MKALKDYLNDIESRLNVDQERQLLSDWKTYSWGDWEEDFFYPQRAPSTSINIEWPEININDALKDEELMIMQQLCIINKQLEEGFGGLLLMRSNYGVGILPSIFGGEIFEMPYEMNTLPNIKHLPGGDERMASLIAQGVPRFDQGWVPKVFSLGKKLQEILNSYPKIGEFVRIDHPDCQGPMDIAELLWGSDIFMAFYDDSELVHSLLRLTTDTYKSFLDEWFSICPSHEDGLHCYFGLAHKGPICIRDDSAMNLSPDMYEEFILPYNNELLDYFGGGSIHSCGRVDHFVPYFKQMKNLFGFNMSQPEYNDLAKVLDGTVGQGIPLLGFASSHLDDLKAIAYPTKGLVSLDKKH